MKPEEWADYKRRTRPYRIWIGCELLHSEAYSSIHYAPTLKVLNWVFERRKVRKIKKRKKRYVEIDEPFSFTYEEGKWRGLTHKQFGRAIRELFDRGFIDLEKQGSGLQKDFSLYRFSERWRKYGGPDFERKEFPRRAVFGCFGEPNRRKQRPISAVDQRPISAVENAAQRPICAVETPFS